MRRPEGLLTLLMLAAIYSVRAQDSLQEMKPIESIVWREDGTDRDGADAMEEISLRMSQRIDLNTASLEHLKELPGLTNEQVERMIGHRERFGPILRLEELQVIASLSPDDIRRIAPYIRITDRQTFAIKQAQLRQELIVRLAGAGTVWNGTEQEYKNTAGNSFRSLLRYRMRIRDQWTMGLRMEKDPGEAWLDDKRRPDYIAGFISYNGRGLLRKLIVGDYAVQFGQGSLAWLGFGTGFTADPALLRRQARGILPYTSSDENAGLRGAAISLGRKSFTMELFVSSRKRDAGISDDSLAQFSSLQTSGIHSTRQEIAGKATFPVTILGCHGSFSGKSKSLGATALFQHLPENLSPNDNAYAQYRIFPEKVVAGSIAGTWHWQNTTCFFESAYRNGSHSLIGGIQAALGKKLNAGIQYRNFGRGPVTLLSDAPGENMRNENENGFVFSLQSRLLPVCTLQVLLQKTTFDWLRYRIDSPSMLDEQQLQVFYNPNRKTQFRLRYRRRSYPVGSNNEYERTTFSQSRESIRFSMTTSLPPFLSLETRFEHLHDGDEKGWLAFTDWSIRPLRSPIQGTIRFALAETTSYAAAIYSQEPDVLYGFSMPGYTGTLTRVVAVIKWRVARSLDIAVKNGWTRSGQDSNLNHPDGTIKSDLSVQLRWNQGSN